MAEPKLNVTALSSTLDNFVTEIQGILADERARDKEEIQFRLDRLERTVYELVKFQGEPDFLKAFRAWWELGTKS